jgi:hypothetical protein
MGKFNPKEHFISMGRNREYLETKWRVVWFREEHPNGRIDTEIQVFGEVGIIKATIWNNDGVHIASGMATVRAAENAKVTWAGRDIEKAETAAIGRALAHAGFGTQFAGDEVDEGEYLSDSPVERKPQPTQRTQPQMQPKPQAQPTATDESSWDENTWKRHAFTVSKFLYTDLDGKYVEQRHSASMKKRMEDTGDYGINPSMTLYEVLSKLIRYRALTDLFIDSGDYGNIFGMSFEDFYDKNGAEATWTRFMDYYIANTQPAKTKAS